MSSNLPYQPKFLNYRTVSAGSYEYGENQNVDPTCDTEGAAFVVVKPLPAGATFESYHAYAGVHVIAATVLSLLTMNGFSDAEDVIYMQVFEDSPTLGDAPIQSFRLAPGASFSWSPSMPLQLTGLYAAASATPSTYTPLETETWVRAEYTTETP